MNDKVIIKELDLSNLKKYDQIPFRYVTNKKYEIKKDKSGMNISFELIDCDTLTKEFDANTEEWKKLFDLSNWKIYVAEIDNKLVGGCVVAAKTKKCRMLNDRDDVALLWDIRVDDNYKGMKIGTKLFNEAINYSKKAGYKKFKIECQNTNVPAVNFYMKKGGVLCSFDEYAYNEFPEETQLIFYIDL